jgi:hypothetical protein
MQLKRYSKKSAPFRQLTPLLWLLYAALMTIVFVYLYRNETRLNLALFACANAIQLNAHEINSRNDLEGRLVAITGIVKADYVVDYPFSLRDQHFLVFERSDTIYHKGKHSGWGAPKQSLNVSSYAVLGRYYFYPPNVISFFNMALQGSGVAEDNEIYIASSPNHTERRPGDGDIKRTFKGIQSLTTITILAQLRGQELVPYFLDAAPQSRLTSWLYDGALNKCFLFYVSTGSFDDLVAGLDDAYERQLHDGRRGTLLSLFLILLFPLWPVFRGIWPAPQSDDYADRSFAMRRRNNLPTMRQCIGLAFVLAAAFVVLYVFIDLARVLSFLVLPTP